MENHANKLEELKEELSKLKLERDMACAWAMYYENSIRYNHGNSEVDRLQSQAKVEIPRIISEAWNPNMVRRFVKLKKSDIEL